MLALTRLPAALIVLAVLTACPTETPDESREPIQNAELGLLFTSLPSGFEVDVNEGSTLRLRGVGEQGRGTITVEVGPEQPHGINVVEIAQRRAEEYEAMEDGESHGSVRLSGPLGTVITARGRFTREGERLEESRLIAVHPLRNAALALSYVYPVGNDSRERMDQLISLLGRLEGYDPAAAPGPEPDSDPAL